MKVTVEIPDEEIRDAIANNTFQEYKKKKLAGFEANGED